MPLDRDVMMKPTTVAQDDVGSDDAVRTDLNVAAELRAPLDYGRGVKTHAV